MKPTTNIDVPGLRASLDYIARARNGRFVAYLSVTGDGDFSPAGEAFAKKQFEGADGAGEALSVTWLPKDKKLAIEFDKQVTREGAALVIGRFLSNVKRNCPKNTSEFFVKPEPSYGEPFNPMATYAETRIH